MSSTAASSPVGRRDCEMLGARRTLPALGFSSGLSAEYQPLDMGVGLLATLGEGEDDTTSSRCCCCCSFATEGRAFNYVVAVLVIANLFLIALETDLGLLGLSSPSWAGLQVDAGLLGLLGGEKAFEAQVRASIDAEGQMLQGLGRQMNKTFHHNVEIVPVAGLSPAGYSFLDLLFLFFFTTELLLRLCDRGCSAWCRDSWNNFDRLLLLLGWTDMLLPYILLPEDEVSVQVLQLLCLLRMSRCLRAIRLFRVLPGLRTAASSYLLAMGAVAQVAAVLVVMNFLLAAVLTSLIGQNSHLWDDHDHGVDILKWFGSIGRSMQTLFRLLTFSGWNELSSVLAVVIPPVFLGLAILAYVLLCSFTFIGLLTGLVSGRLMHSEKTAEQQHLSNIEEIRWKFSDALVSLFASSDVARTGYLSRGEFKVALDANPIIFDTLRRLEVDATVSDLLTLFDRLAAHSQSGGSVEILSLVEALVMINQAARSSEVFEVKNAVWSLRQQVTRQTNTIHTYIASNHEQATLDLKNIVEELRQHGLRSREVSSEVVTSVSSFGNVLSALQAELLATNAKLDILSRQITTSQATSRAEAQTIAKHVDTLSAKVDAHKAAVDQSHEEIRSIVATLSDDLTALSLQSKAVVGGEGQGIDMAVAEASPASSEVLRASGAEAARWREEEAQRQEEQGNTNHNNEPQGVANSETEGTATATPFPVVDEAPAGATLAADGAVLPASPAKAARTESEVIAEWMAELDQQRGPTKATTETQASTMPSPLQQEQLKVSNGVSPTAALAPAAAAEAAGAAAEAAAEPQVLQPELTNADEATTAGLAEAPAPAPATTAQPAATTAAFRIPSAEPVVSTDSAAAAAAAAATDVPADLALTEGQALPAPSEEVKEGAAVNGAVAGSGSPAAPSPHSLPGPLPTTADAGWQASFPDDVEVQPSAGWTASFPDLDAGK